MANALSDNAVRGARNLRFNRVVRDLVGRSDRIDFYKFTASSSIDFSLTLSGLRANANVRLLNRNRALITASAKPGRQSESIVETLAAGTYYIQVQVVGRQNTPYSLRASATPVQSPSSGGDDSGGTLATARNLGSLSTEYRTQESIGDTDAADYYRFTLSQISDFNAVVISRNVPIDLYSDANNNGLAEADERLVNGRGDYNISGTLLPGTYFLELKSSRSFSTQYELAIAAVPNPSITNLPTDPGNSTSTALNLTSFPTAPIKDFVGAFDSKDYYKFTLSQISNLNVDISGLLRTVSADLYYDANTNGLIDEGELLESGAEGVNNSFGLSNISRAVLPGTYFLEVETSSNFSTQYELAIAVTPQPSNLTTDPGNTASTAYNLGAFLGIQTLRDFVGRFDELDYYKFTLNAPRSFNAQVINPLGTGSLTFMTLYRDGNNNGSIDDGELVDISGFFDISQQQLQPGTYLLKVEPSRNNVSVQYDLTIGVS